MNLFNVDDSKTIEYGINKILNNIMDKSMYVKLYIDTLVKQRYPTKHDEFSGYLLELTITKIYFRI